MRESETLVLGARGDFEKAADYIFTALNRIAQWERLARLQNEATELNPEVVDFQLIEVANDVEHAIVGFRRQPAELFQNAR